MARTVDFPDIVPIGLRLGNPSPEAEGNDWSHKELLAHLRNRGLTVAGRPTIEGGFWGPAMRFHFGPDGEEYLKNFDDDLPLSKDEAHVLKLKSIQDAKDKAGAMVERGYSWGRFLFQASPEILEKIKRELE